MNVLGIEWNTIRAHPDGIATKLKIKKRVELTREEDVAHHF